MVLNSEPTKLQECLINWVYVGLNYWPCHNQVWLAEETGFSEKHISDMLNGKSGSFEAWDKLLKAAGVYEDLLSHMDPFK
jgi:hypothetical protein